MLRPRVLLLDEPSLGLAPVIINDLYDTLGRVNKEFRISMLIVEQNANLALEIADYAYVLESGVISLQGPASEIASHDGVRAAYLGDL
jgi:branched-chain amino acid transport system ATP-binding protein